MKSYLDPIADYTFKNYRETLLSPKERLIKGIFSANSKIRKYRVAMENFVKAPSDTLVRNVENKVDDFIKALAKAEISDQDLSFELIASRKLEYQSPSNVQDDWSKDEEQASFMIWLDTIFGIVLKRNDKPIAVLGLDLDYRANDSTAPAKFILRVKQMQGVNKMLNGEKQRNNLQGINISKVFLDLVEKVRSNLNVRRMEIVMPEKMAYYYNAFHDVLTEPDRDKIRDRFRSRYDEAALKRGFKLDEKAGVYYKIFENADSSLGNSQRA